MEAQHSTKEFMHDVMDVVRKAGIGGRRAWHRSSLAID
jgi:hypothetical protein